MLALPARIFHLRGSVLCLGLWPLRLCSVASYHLASGKTLEKKMCLTLNVCFDSPFKWYLQLFSTQAEFKEI